VTPLNAAGIVSVTVAAVIADGPVLVATIVYVTDVPGTSIATPSVLVIDRSPVGFSASVSVAELLPGVGSVTPPGTAIAAVLMRLPVADALIVAVTVNVAAAPTGRFNEALMLPLPLAGHEAPPLVEHVHVTPLNAAGIVSVTVAAVTADGPALLATIVYVTDVPGTSVATPSVLVITRSAVGTSVSVSVAELLAGVGSVAPPGRAMLAVFASDPVAVDEIVPVTVNVAVPLDNRVTEALIEPEPEAGHVDPDDAAHVHVTPVSEAGIVSVTVAAVMVEGPALEATIVYVTDEPGTAVVAPSVLVTTRSAVGVNESVSVAELLPEAGSVMPAPTETVAVLVSEPVAPGATVPLTVNVAVPPTGRSTEALMLPLPDAGHVAPPLTEQVHVAPVSAAGNVSVTFDAGAADGPAFDATIV
jgi:hypothetical protein